MPTITESVEISEGMIDEYKVQFGSDDEDALTDILTNLMHWADANGYDFTQELNRAVNMFQGEQADEK